MLRFQNWSGQDNCETKMSDGHLHCYLGGPGLRKMLGWE